MLLASQILSRYLMIGGAAICSLLTFSGCATQPRGAMAASQPARPSVVGAIAVVDEEKRFVLIDLGSNLYVPAPGAAMHSTNAAGAIAHLKASPEQKRPFIAADIIDGEPAVGDEVVR
jgi:hypothetical protein